MTKPLIPNCRYLRVRFVSAMIAAVVGVIALSALQAASVGLAWNPNSETNIAGYKLYYGEPPGNYSSQTNVGNVTAFTVNGLTSTKTYSFYVTAINTIGLESDPSSSVNYTVPGTATNTAPVVVAGPDQTVILPASVSLQGTASDDGLPTPPGTLTVAWSRVSGPGTVVFVNPNSLATAASFTAVGTYVLRLTANDGALTASDNLTVTVITNNPTQTVAISVEAESGTLTSPMIIGTQGTVQYVSTSTSQQGTANYTVALSASSAYMIWCRVVAPSDGEDSFFVSVDSGTEDIFDANPGYTEPGFVYSSAWKWVRVNGRGASGVEFSVNPRVFNLSAGVHNINVRGRESNTLLDKLIITNDPDLLPLDPTGQDDPPTVSSITATSQGTTLTWVSTPGRSYRVVYKSYLEDAQWTAASPDLVASGSTLYWVDLVPASSTQRFYSVLLLP